MNRVETGDIVPDRSNWDLMDDSGGVGRDEGEGGIRENESRRGGRCIFLATEFFPMCSGLDGQRGERSGSILFLNLPAYREEIRCSLVHSDLTFVSEDENGR